MIPKRGRIGSGAGSRIEGAFRSLFRLGYPQTLLALGIAQGVGFALRLVLLQWLPAESFARYALLIETLNALTSSATLGIPLAASWHGLRDGALERHFAAAFRIMCGLWLLVLTVFYAAQYLFSFLEDAQTARFAAYLAPFVLSFAFYNHSVVYLAAAQRAQERATLIALHRLGFAACLLVAVRFYGFQGVLYGILTFFVLTALLLFLRYGIHLPRRIALYPYKELLQFGGWNALGELAILVVPFVLLTQTQLLLSDLTQLSQLAVALTLALAVRMSMVPLKDLLFPRLMRASQRGEFGSMLRRALWLYLLVSAAALGASWLIFPPLIQTIVGSRYQQGVQLFYTLSVAEVFLGWGLFIESCLQIFRRLRTRAFINLVCLLALFLLLHALVPQKGVTGAAQAFIAYATLRFVLVLLSLVSARSRR